jgi:hypothetical protein
LPRSRAVNGDYLRWKLGSGKLINCREANQAIAGGLRFTPIALDWIEFSRFADPRL